MAIKVGGTSVISNALALENITSVDATTAEAITAAGVGGAGEYDFVASGAISTGDIVSLNADGTVSVTAQTNIPAGAGTPVVFESATTSYVSATYDSNAQKVVIAYRDDGNSGYGTAVVGTVSGTSISFGTPAVFESATSNFMSATYDSNAQKVVIAYQDEGNFRYGTAIVGTVSGTSISFGSPAVFESASSAYISATYDAIAQKVVIAYQDEGNSFYGTAIVGTVSGTSISFGSPVVFESTFSAAISAIYDANAQKVVIAYSDWGNSKYGTAIVGTVSGTSISFGSPAVFESANTSYVSATYDANAQKVVIAYRDSGNSSFGTAVVGTVSGTSISFGSPVVFESSYSLYIFATYDANAQKVVIAYRDFGNSNYGTAAVFQNAFTTTNASSYIGISTQDIADTATGTITIDGGLAQLTVDNYNLANASYDSVSFSVAGQETDPNALFFKTDGTKMYILGSSGDDVNEYNLSTAWDVSTAAYVQNFSVSAKEAGPNGLSFKPDGTKMYIIGSLSDSIHEYNLGTAWDVSSSVFSQTLSVLTDSENPAGLFFKPDGTKFYTVGSSGVDINEYSLSAAWDISTASYVQNFSVSSQESNPSDVFFDTSGTKMYVIGFTGVEVNEYSLSTAWSISTATFVRNFSVTAQESFPQSIFFKPDGTKMYIVGQGSDTVFQYTTGTFGGFTTNTPYFVSDSGTFSTTNNGRKIGKATSTSNLLVDTALTGNEMNAYLGSLV